MVDTNKQHGAKPWWELKLDFAIRAKTAANDAKVSKAPKVKSPTGVAKGAVPTWMEDTMPPLNESAPETTDKNLNALASDVNFDETCAKSRENKPSGFSLEQLLDPDFCDYLDQQ